MEDSFYELVAYDYLWPGRRGHGETWTAWESRRPAGQPGQPGDTSSSACLSLVYNTGREIPHALQHRGGRKPLNRRTAQSSSESQHMESKTGESLRAESGRG